jgi:amidophosphoribosyltransferase
VRPLVIGRLNNKSFALASETVALDVIKAEYIGEVHPGEMVVIDNSGMRRLQIFKQRERLPCIFEHVYFGRPDSVQFGSKYSNAEIRREFGRQLYREHPAYADLVCAVPDSSVDAALGYSEESIMQGDRIPLYFGLVRSHYIGRTFIEPTQSERETKIMRKFNPNTSVINGKRIVVIDDSIVRGSTIKQIVSMLRESGAKEVHLRISSPPYVHGCYLGIDTAEREALIGYQLGDTEKIRAFLKADSLGYLSKHGMLANPMLNNKGFCTFCFDGIEKIARK